MAILKDSKGKIIAQTSGKFIPSGGQTVDDDGDGGRQDYTPVTPTKTEIDLGMSLPESTRNLPSKEVTASQSFSGGQSKEPPTPLGKKNQGSVETTGGMSTEQGAKLVTPSGTVIGSAEVPIRQTPYTQKRQEDGMKDYVKVVSNIGQKGIQNIQSLGRNVISTSTKPVKEFIQRNKNDEIVRIGTKITNIGKTAKDKAISQINKYEKKIDDLSEKVSPSTTESLKSQVKSLEDLSNRRENLVENFNKVYGGRELSEAEYNQAVQIEASIKNIDTMIESKKEGLDYRIESENKVKERNPLTFIKAGITEAVKTPLSVGKLVLTPIQSSKGIIKSVPNLPKAVKESPATTLGALTGGIIASKVGGKALNFIKEPILVEATPKTNPLIISKAKVLTAIQGEEVLGTQAEFLVYGYKPARYGRVVPRYQNELGEVFGYKPKGKVVVIEQPAGVLSILPPTKVSKGGQIDSYLITQKGTGKRTEATTFSKITTETSTADEAKLVNLNKLDKVSQKNVETLLGIDKGSLASRTPLEGTKVSYGDIEVKDLFKYPQGKGFIKTIPVGKTIKRGKLATLEKENLNIQLENVYGLKEVSRVQEDISFVDTTFPKLNKPKRADMIKGYSERGIAEYPPIDDGLEILSTGKNLKFYHSTKPERVSSILNEGLIPSSKTGIKQGLTPKEFVSTGKSIEEVKGFSKGKGSVLEINIPESKVEELLYKTDLPSGVNEVRFKEVPSKYIKLVQERPVKELAKLEQTRVSQQVNKAISGAGLQVKTLLKTRPKSKVQISKELGTTNLEVPLMVGGTSPLTTTYSGTGTYERTEMISPKARTQDNSLSLSPTKLNENVVNLNFNIPKETPVSRGSSRGFEITRPIESEVSKSVSKPITREITKPLEKSITRQLQRIISKPITKPLTKIKPKPLIQPKTTLVPPVSLSKSSSKKIEDRELFEVFVTKRGKDVSLGKTRSKGEAEKVLKSELKTSLRAGGYVTKGGKALSVSELEGFDLGEFATSKVTPTKIIQRREKRLGSRKEVSEIQFFKKSKVNLFDI